MKRSIKLIYDEIVDEKKPYANLSSDTLALLGEYSNEMLDEENTILFYNEAIKKGSHIAMSNLGMFYYEKKCYDEMLKYFLIGVNNNCCMAMINLSFYYAKDKNNEEAIKYIKLAQKYDLNNEYNTYYLNLYSFINEPKNFLKFYRNKNTQVADITLESHIYALKLCIENKNKLDYDNVVQIYSLLTNIHKYKYKYKHLFVIYYRKYGYINDLKTLLLKKFSDYYCKQYGLKYAKLVLECYQLLHDVNIIVNNVNVLIHNKVLHMALNDLYAKNNYKIIKQIFEKINNFYNSKHIYMNLYDNLLKNTISTELIFLFLNELTSEQKTTFLVKLNDIKYTKFIKTKNEECCICYENKTLLRLNNCIHYVCTNCLCHIKKCPYCRAQL